MEIIGDIRKVGLDYWNDLELDICWMMKISQWTCGICASAFVVYWYSTCGFSAFKGSGIPGPSPLPFIGTTLDVFRKGVWQMDIDFIAKYGNVVGTFEGRAPVVIVADTKLLKQVLVKDFHIFPIRRSLGIDEYPMKKAITRIQGEHWKHVRSLLTPTFSANKLKQMLTHINSCSATLVDNLFNAYEEDEAVDIKEYLGAFTMDAIACTAFGLNINSQKNKDDPFVRHAKMMFNISVMNPLVLLALLIPQSLGFFKRMGLTLIPRQVTTFFVDIVDQAIAERSKAKPTMMYADFLQLMLNAEVEDLDTFHNQNEKDRCTVEGPTGTWTKKGLTHEEILAQSLIFFVAGYETTATTLSFLTYNMAMHPDIQDRVCAEIEEVLNGEDELTYDHVSKLNFLEQCICETLRLYPPAVRTNRVCCQDTTLGDFSIKKGWVVAIPIYALHRDAHAWPNPDQFIPERFSPEAKACRDPYYWQPFGMGPRSCIGIRLAMLEIKIAAAHILRKFTFVACKETETTLTLARAGLLRPVRPIKLKLQKR